MTPETDDRDRERVARGLAEVVRTALGPGGPQAALDLIVTRLPPLVHARQCFVIVVGSDQRARIIASSGLTGQNTEFLPRHHRDGIAYTAMTERRAISSPDVLNDPAIELSAASRGFIEREGYRAAVAVPLLQGERAFGALVTGRDRPAPFSTAQVETALMFAELATLAAERARPPSPEALAARLDEAARADESARLRADQRASEERMRLVIDTALDAVITIDVDGRITGWNAQAERTFGWSRAEAVGRVLSETIIPPRYREAHEEGLRRYRASGEGRVINRRLELSAIHRDGHEFPVELSISPVSRSAVTTFTAFVRDITRRAEAELAVRRQASLVRLLQVVAVAANEAPTWPAALQIGVNEVCAYSLWPVGDAWVLADDGSGDLLPAHTWHLDPPERYRGFKSATDSTRLPRGVGLPGRVLASGQAAWIMDLATDTNFPRSSDAAAAGLKCAFGFPVLAGSDVVAVLEFFTTEPSEPDPALLAAMGNIGTQLGRVFERERAEAALRLARDAAEAASRAKSSFLANMSHELRTPLNAILGYAQVLERSADLGQASQRAVGVIDRSGRHLLSLINEILDLAKIESGTIEMHEAPFDLLALLTGVADLIRARAEERGLAFTCEYPVVLPAAVRGDEKRMRQVLTNLLDNAVKYTPRGSVRLRATRVDCRYRFAVEDTGIGIDADQLPRIFETFHQAHRQQDFIEGTGLGLAISRTLVGLMGGTLEVASTPGEGSRFWFELELPEAEASDDGGPRRPAGLRGERRRLVVVDDDADSRHLLRDLLAPIGFQVDVAEDAESALARVAAAPPDAVLIDLRMPGMSGLEATRRLRRLDSGRPLVVIAMSASVFGHNRAECIDAGADDFLAKPFRLDELLDVLGRHLRLVPVDDTDPGEHGRPAARSAVPAALLFPPREVLGPLLEQAQRGDIRQILEHAGRIEAGDPRYGPFAAELRALAHRFQVNKLCEFLDQGPAS